VSSEAPPTWEQFDALYARIGRAEAALVVAREREQRLRGALQQIANHNVRAPVTGTSADDPCDWHCTAQQRDLARAALVDEPAAACTCWPDEANAMCPLHGMDAPAAATLAEPEGSVEEAQNGATVEARVATPPGSASAAADEPPRRSCAKPARGIYGVQSRCARPLGHVGGCNSIWNYRDWKPAAADEPGETPA
jgi:hypothetical protein